MGRSRRRRISGAIALVAAILAIVSACATPAAPDPLDSELVERRARAVHTVEGALDEVDSALGGVDVGRASSDECYDGQQNYKRDDGYAHRCTIRRARVVALDGDFRARLAQFDRRLFASGWGCYGGPCEETLSGLADEYWDLRAAEAGGNPFPISRLPSGSGYQRGDLNLGVRYAGADASGRSWLESAARRERGGVFDFYERSAPLDVEAVLSKAASHEYVVVIAIELDYYLN